MQLDYTKHPDGSHRHLLVVEQDATLLNTLARALELEGFRVSRASQLQQAKRWLEVENFDAILLADQFEDENPIDFIKTLRGLGTTAPILYLHTKLNEANKVAATEAGVNILLTKPFTFSELRNSLYQAFAESVPDLFAPPPVWGKKSSASKDSIRSSLWLGILASILVAVALYLTMVALEI